MIGKTHVESAINFQGRFRRAGVDAVYRWRWRVLMMALLIISGGAVGGTVNQWPIGVTTFNGYWPANWAPINGLNDGTASGGGYPQWDFVGDTTNPGFYMAKGPGPTGAGDYLFFRMRVAYTGTAGTPSGTTPAAPFDNGSLMVLIQKNTTDNGVKQPQWAFTWDAASQDASKHGMEMQVYGSGGSGSAWSATTMNDVDGNGSGKSVPDFNAGRTGDAYIRTVDTQSTTNLGVTTFVDFAISCNYLTYVSDYTNNRNGYSGWSGAKVDLSCTDTLYFQLGSIVPQNDHAAIGYDVGAGQTPASIVPTSTEKLPSGAIATYAILSVFNAKARGGQVAVEWDTESELGTQGFELARRDADGDFQPLHEGLITGQNPAGEGGSYRFVDATAMPGLPATYRLTEVETNGNRREVGQYSLTPVATSDQGLAARESSANLNPGQAEYSPRKLTPAEAERVEARQAERQLAGDWGSRALASGPSNSGSSPANRAAIGVRETGLYQVGNSALAQALGWPEGKVKGLIQAGQLRLTNQGAEIAWQAADKDQGILFYGEASRSIYDPVNVYVVRQGAGTRMAKTQVRAQGPQGADSFMATVSAEENRFAGTGMAKDPEEDYWFWSSLMNGGAACGTGTQFLGCGSRTFTLMAPEATGSGQARLRIWLRGVSATSANPVHAFRVSLNGAFVGEGQWDGLTDYRLDLPVAGSLLRADGKNQLQIMALADTGVAVAANIFYLDRLELDYPRHYLAAQDSLRVTGESGALVVAYGFTSPTIQVYDLTDPRRPQVVTGAQSATGAGGYQVSLVPASPTTPYLLVTPGAVRSPDHLRAMETLGWEGGTDGGARYLVIGPGEFYAEGSQPVQRLLSLRYGQGLSGRFVPLQALYDDYGDGQKTPHAIRRFLAEAHSTWPVPPAYVVLAGKGTFDPKDLLGYGTDRLPVLMAMTPLAGLIAADQRFVDFDDDGLGDLAIGRLPAATAAEFAGMVDKLIAHEDAGRSATPHAILVADGPDAGGNYTANSEVAANRLLDAGLAASEVQRLYLGPMTSAAVRNDLLAGLRGGADLLNYFGHAGVTALDHGLLSVADATALNHQEQVPVMLGMTCLINRFEFPQVISLGEALLLNPAGGAVAVWSSGGHSFDTKAGAMNDAFLIALLQAEVPHLGDAIQAALVGAAQSYGPETAPGIYNLLGDPATRNPTY